MKGCDDVVFSQSGVTSWGYAWEWTFDGGVELKAPYGHTLMVTDLNTRVSEYNFLEQKFSRNTFFFESIDE